MILDGRCVMVTGTSRGIGAALAEEFATAGSAVVLLGRDEAPFTRTAAGASPRRTTEWLLTGVAHQQDR